MLNPYDPASVTQMKGAAIALNELFVTLKESGFASEEALELVKEVIRTVQDRDDG